MSPFKKLVLRRMSMLAVPEGGGFTDAVTFLTDLKRFKATAQEAREWAKEAIALVRAGAEPNPWKDATDDQIAEEILEKAGL